MMLDSHGNSRAWRLDQSRASHHSGRALRFISRGSRHCRGRSYLR